MFIPSSHVPYAHLNPAEVDPQVGSNILCQGRISVAREDLHPARFWWLFSTKEGNKPKNSMEGRHGGGRGKGGTVAIACMP